MDNNNTHIDSLFNKKAAEYNTDSSFAKMDFESLRANLPTLPASTILPKATLFSKLGVKVFIAIVSVVTIAVVFYFNSNKTNTIQPNNGIAEKRTFENIILPDSNNISNNSSNDQVKETKEENNKMLTNVFDSNVSKAKLTTQIHSQKNNTNHTQAPLLAMKSFLNALSSNSQFFNIDPTRDTTIVCANGTGLLIKANSFTNGNKIILAGNVQVEVKEAYNFTNILANDMHTLSNGNCLENDGTVYLNAKQNSEVIYINIKNPIQISIPTRNKKNGMQLFYLDKNANDNVVDNKSNWIPNGQTQSESIQANYIFWLRNFGWLSASKFIKKNVNATDIGFRTIEKDSLKNYKTVLILPNTKSIINLAVSKNQFVAKNIPLGEEAYIVSFKNTNNRILSIIKKITTSANIILLDEYKEIPLEQVKATLDAIRSVP
jgi:hypothetical protein